MGEETTLDDHSDLSRRLLIDIENFVDEIGHRGCTALLDKVLSDGHYLKGKKLGQPPERFIEDHLIFPVLETLGHSLLPRPVQYAPRWSHGRGIPDFALTTVPVEAAKQHNVRLFGESKPPNKLNYARNDVEEYLNKDLDFHAVAILTDGIHWELWIRPRKEGVSNQYTPYALASLEEPLTTVKKRNLEQESYQKHDARRQIDVEAFSRFTDTALLALLEEEFEAGYFE